MKKIKHILVCGLAVVASAVAVQAQTLTQDWKMTTGLPSAAEARDGIGGKGKIWTNDKSSAKLTYWDESGVHSLSVGAGGTAITMDDAGNIIISTSMYILGQNEVGDAWNPTSGIAMTWESGNVWSATVTTAPGRENLGFVSVLAEDNNSSGWDYVNGNRWGLENDKQEGALAEKLTVSKNSNSINVGVGTFFIRMNLDDNTLYIAPTKLYVIGTSNKAEGHHWASDDDSYMAESDPETPGVFTFDPIDLKVEGKAVGEEAEADLAYFAFVTGIDAEWGPVNNSRWCPNNKDGELTNKTDFTDFGKHYNGAFCIKNGAYKLTVDLNTKTVNAEYLTSSGVEQVGAEAAGVIAADGQIRIVGDAATVSVYNAAGQAVAINSAERTFAVARGMYVVVVDGKATKVIVR